MLKQQSEAAEPEPQPPLSLVINRLIRNYLLRRAEEKSGVDLETFKAGGKIDWERIPPVFKDAKQKLGESTFLEFRSRRDQAFVDHFVATFCSVKQYLNDADYQIVAKALLDRDQRDDVKTLTLLALSANS